ncbi:MAG: hypothetical protein M0P10_11385 [Sphaerochaetaceae bacterium]|nr:hypothetical protein [Sphaerochaetaceae bacterium]
MNIIKVVGIALVCSFATVGCSSLTEISNNLIDTTNYTDVIISAVNGTDNNTEGNFWKINYFSDDFGDSTNEKYLEPSHILSGLFSNSATTNSDLTARILIPYNEVQLFMEEYGLLPVKGSISKIRYKITIKLANGSTEDLGSAWNNNDRVIFNSKQSSKIIVALTSGNSFKLFLKENTPGEYAVNGASYVVVIPQSVGFSTMFKKAFPEPFATVDNIMN